MDKSLFIINPISGAKNKKDVPSLVRKYLSGKLDIEIALTERAGHAHDLALRGIKEGFQRVVAVGGDGTMNEVASALVGSDVKFGLIPMGSGNGLARHLHIPLHTESAIHLLLRPHVKRIDTCQMNGKPFFCTAGLGFDANVSALFNKSKERGLRSYIKSVTKEYLHYQPQQYTIQYPHINIVTKAFLLTFANASQYGNNAYISPHSDVQDGLIETCIVQPFPKYQLPIMATRMFMQSLHNSSNVSILSVPEVTIQREAPGMVHVDGEPMEMGKEIIVKIIPSSLSFMAGR